jgi:hypothetical protein
LGPAEKSGTAYKIKEGRLNDYVVYKKIFQLKSGQAEENATLFGG